MPYIVTTKRQRRSAAITPQWTNESRRAVATLDEAFAEVQAIRDKSGSALFIKPLSESGGTVGPLPDGTVIEVEATTWGAIARAVPMPVGLPRHMLRAFNAKRLPVL